MLAAPVHEVHAYGLALGTLHVLKRLACELSAAQVLLEEHAVLFPRILHGIGLHEELDRTHLRVARNRAAQREPLRVRLFAVRAHDLRAASGHIGNGFRAVLIGFEMHGLDRRSPPLASDSRARSPLPRAPASARS